MNPTASIMMYSGMKNPEKDLTEEEVQTLKDLVTGLETVYPAQPHSHLGFSGYCASFDDMHVIASMYGHVRVWDTTGKVTAYTDTTGILAYLCKIMTPVMVKHIEDGQKAMDDYWTNLHKDIG